MEDGVGCWLPPRLGRHELIGSERALDVKGVSPQPPHRAQGPRNTLWLLSQVPRQLQSPARLRQGRLRQLEEAAVSRAGNWTWMVQGPGCQARLLDLLGDAGPRSWNPGMAGLTGAFSVELEMGVSSQSLPWQMEKWALRLTQGH